jgi:hypothetical protein
MRKHDKKKMYELYLSGKTNSEIAELLNTHTTYISEQLTLIIKEFKILHSNERLISKINLTPFIMYDNDCVEKVRKGNFSQKEVEAAIMLASWKVQYKNN